MPACFDLVLIGGTVVTPWASSPAAGEIIRFIETSR